MRNDVRVFSTEAEEDGNRRSVLCRAVFQVGVIGHRDVANVDLQALTMTIADVLKEVLSTTREVAGGAAAQLFAPGTPKVRCISALAEGADRIATKAALEHGLDLQCVLPFSQQEYLSDFPSERSRREFSDVLGSASAVLELDGTRERAGEAYFAVGQVVADQSDILLAVWDGAEARGLGGTGQIIAESNKRGVPVMVVDSLPPHGVRFKEADAFTVGSNPDWRQMLAEIIWRCLLIGPPDGAASNDLNSYFNEPTNGVPFYGRLYRVLERVFLLGVNGRAKYGLYSDLPPDDCAAAQRPLETQPLDAHFRWADGLAIAYGSLHRSFSMLRYLLLIPMIAGLLCAYFVPGPGFKAIGFGIQAASLIAILALSRANRKAAWHRRFADYRLLSELLRHQRYLGALGQTLPAVREPPHRPEAAPEWVNWYFRSITREAGLPSDKLTPDRLERLRNLLRSQLEEQRSFHDRAGQRYATLASRLERIGAAMYWGGLVAVTLRAIAVAGDWAGVGLEPPRLKLALDIATLILPALAPVFLGLRSQGEYPRLAAQYRAMNQALAGIIDRLGRLKGPTHEQLSNLASRAAAAMETEAADWRLIVRGRPVSHM